MLLASWDRTMQADGPLIKASARNTRIDGIKPTNREETPPDIQCFISLRGRRRWVVPCMERAGKRVNHSSSVSPWRRKAKCARS
jgi:hypothetical protein